MENRVLKKIIIFVTVFMLVFSNCGYTLQALAATDGITLFGFNLFGSGNIDFDVYFLDENGKKQNESTADVNSEMTMVLEFNPKADGYLKSGTIKAVSGEEGEANFKFERAFVDNGDDANSLVITSQADTQLLQSETTVEANEDATNTAVENTVADENVVAENVTSENTVVANTVEEDATNTVVENTVENNTIAENVVVEETVEENVEEPEVATEEPVVEEEEFVDEEAALKEEAEETTISVNNIASATVVADDEIKIENVIENTKVYVNISFKTGETLNIEDLYKQIKIEFEGTYINVDLEEIAIELFENINVGWTYSKDIEVSSEYTKVSPFKIGETEGTIVENTITVKRDVTEDKYLPLKETKIKLDVPTLAGNTPENMDVSALKLKATLGEDIHEVVLSKDNWEYDEKTNTLTITVENTNCTFTYGEDIYVVTYRYNSYSEEAEVSLKTSGTVEVTEFSGKDDNTIVKNLDKTEKVIANVGELITYSIGTTEDKIQKGKINANYNSEEEKYESEFTTTVNVNILTNDVLNEFTLKDTKEVYIDKEGLEFETTDVKYKKIKFRYAEIQEFLEQGGSIEIKNSNGELFYTLNKDLIKSDEDAEVSIQGDVRGIEVSFKNITVNGNVNIEFTKAIGKSSFDKSAFANFKKLESKISGIVKYSEDSDGTELPVIKTEKEFEDSKTNAEISMNRLSLSTTGVNENVEFKIELNNDKETSDLYVNPVFEIALPKYVTNIDLKSINMLYESGLSVGNTTTYRAEDGTLRMRIEVNGTQTEFSEGEFANGTNIIIGANIEVDKYAPRKDDQIKLYYINAGVTNYASQTKWTLGVNVPAGILKTTNGFDSYVFKFDAPSGFLTINEIQNYDGENSVVTSIKQGEETREIAMESTSRVARMNLIAINNTENKCTDVAFLGRFPMKDATDVKTGQKLETNVDTTIISRITEDEENPLSAKIYYSTNANADKNLSDPSNGWTENPSGLENVKSFLIIPDNTVEPGYLFKYTYEFIIPENLPYEAKIYGSFGGFYNNHSDVAVVYEATGADLVGVVTKTGPKVEATLSVDIGDGADIGEARYMKYTLVIANSGSEDLEYITVNLPKPDYTTICEVTGNNGFGNNNYIGVESTGKSWTISRLAPGETSTYTMYVKASEIPTEEVFYSNLYKKAIYKDDQGYYYEKVTEAVYQQHADGEETVEPVEDVILEPEKREKVYVNDPLEIYIKSQATVQVGNLAGEFKSNETKNKLIDSKFDISVNTENKSPLPLGTIFKYMSSIKNISGEEQKNVKVSIALPETVEYMDTEVYTYSHTSLYDKNNVEYDETTRTVTFTFPEIYKDEIVSAYVRTKVVKGSNSELSTLFTVTTEDGEVEKSSNMDRLYAGPIIELEQTTNLTGSTVLEDEKVEITIALENKGNYVAQNVLLEDEVSENIENAKIEISGSISDTIEVSNNRSLSRVLGDIPASGRVILKLTGTASRLNGTEKNISNKAEISADNLTKQATDVVNIAIKENQNKNTAPEYEPETPAATNEGQNTNNGSGGNGASDYVAPSTGSQGNGTNANNAQNNNNQSNAQNNNTQNNATENNTNPENQVTNTKISGFVWVDTNRNGRKDDGESGIGSVEVRLYKNNSVQKVTTTSSNGEYTFSNIEAGNYSVMFAYDADRYITTGYKQVNVEEDLNSDASSITEGSAVTNKFTVTDLSIENLNLGLQERDKVDLAISKYITKAVVKTGDTEDVHDYNNLELAKVDIKAKKLNETSVKFEYKIVVENKGNVAGKLGTIIDYVPSGLVFDASQNTGWEQGENGTVYSNFLKDRELAVGEKAELTLVLSKDMTAENTGVIANKVAGNFENDEDGANNTSTQEMIVTVSTGRGVNIIFIFIIAIIAFLAGYQAKTGKIKFSKFNLNKNFKRIYK